MCYMDLYILVNIKMIVNLFSETYVAKCFFPLCQDKFHSFIYSIWYKKVSEGITDTNRLDIDCVSMHKIYIKIY